MTKATKKDEIPLIERRRSELITMAVKAKKLEGGEKADHSNVTKDKLVELLS